MGNTFDWDINAHKYRERQINVGERGAHKEQRENSRIEWMKYKHSLLNSTSNDGCPISSVVCPICDCFTRESIIPIPKSAKMQHSLTAAARCKRYQLNILEHVKTE